MKKTKQTPPPKWSLVPESNSITGGFRVYFFNLDNFLGNIPLQGMFPAGCHFTITFQMISATKNVGLKLPHRLVTGQGHGNLISESSSGLRMTNSLQSERPGAGAMKIRF